MSRKTDRQRRLRLFGRGNNQCPICLTTFTRMLVASGKKVTLEHAPPQTLGGKVVCLTCTDCNNRASRLDNLAKMAEKARSDHLAGRGTRVEVDFFGAGIVSGYVRPKDDEMAARLAKGPVPTSIGQLRGGVMQLPSLPVGPELDVKRGIRFRIRRPNPHRVAVSWLRSAYLLVFSLLGREGYRYAKCQALAPIREQIMKPDEVRIRGGLGGECSGVDFPVDPVIMLNYAHKPPFWAVKFGGRIVLLPCGGSIERYLQLTQGPIDVSLAIDRVGCWVPTQFRNEGVIAFAMNHATDIRDIDFVGGLLEVRTKEGDLWEWIIVNYQENEVVALPFRRKGVEQEEDGGGVMMMLGKDEAIHRRDQSQFVAASPSQLMSLSVEG